MNINIKKSNLSTDFDFIIQCELALENMYSQKYYKKQTRANIVNTIQKHSKKTFYLIAYIDNNPTGILAYSFNKKFSKLQIDSLFIKQKFRNKGIGKKLLNKAKQIAQKQKCKFIRLFVEKMNPRGIKFYQRNKFQIIGYKMEKPLS